MIVPVGERYQQTLYLFEKKDGKLSKAALLPTLFVPMTGKAEDGRKVQPDPVHPTINNGGFEEPTAADEELVPAWYYQRQLKLVEGKQAPQGTHYVTITNTHPGRGAQALQGMAVDGRKVDELNVSVWVKATNIRPGTTADQLPQLAITYYDERRATVGQSSLGPWHDSFDWQKVTDKLHVPVKAREAIVRIGLGGATGEISFDDVRIQAAE